MTARSRRRANDRVAVKDQRRAERRRRIVLGAGATLSATATIGSTALVATPADAATFSVTNTDDSGQGSLRQAVFEASNDTTPGVDVITFAPGVTGTITLSTGEIEFYGSIDIQGPGADNLTISAGPGRIFETNDDGDNIISGLTLTGGNTSTGVSQPKYGGAVLQNSGPNSSLTMNDVVLSGNTADGGGAIALYGTGQVVLNRVTMTDNSTTDTVGVEDYNNRGGAIQALNVGSLTITDSSISDSSSVLDGGAIYALGTPVTITGSTLDGNQATYDDLYDDRAGGGGVFVTGDDTDDLTITDSTFSNNTSVNDGAGLYSTGADVTITGSTFDGNQGGDGGAVYVNGGSLALSDSVLSDNGALYNGGGIYGGGGTAISIESTLVTGNTAGVDGTFYDGGGVYMDSGSLTVSDSVVSGNAATHAGGGIYVSSGSTGLVEGTLITGNTATNGAGVYLYSDGESAYGAITNSTITGNSALESGGGVQVRGPEATMDIESSTIAGNTATTGAGGVHLGGDAVSEGVLVSNSIVAGNANADLGTEDTGSFVTDFSLIQTADPTIYGVRTDGSDLIGVDPQLGELADNGGPTQTLLPSATSPVLDAAGSFAQGRSANREPGRVTDQRGLPRPVDLPRVANSTLTGANGADMGAVERQVSEEPKAPTTTTQSPPALLTGSCDGAVATIVAKPGVPTVGTPGRDVIVGTAGADSISGGGGDDLICGLGGDDAIDTGAGRNRVFGGDGNDLIRGGASRDVLFGDAGDDRIYGGRANDTIDGGAGNDTVRGNRGNDKIKGGGGKDSLRGGKNRDTLTGGPGKDKVRGGQAKDKVTQ